MDIASHLWFSWRDPDSVGGSIHPLDEELEGDQADEEEGGPIIDVRVRAQPLVVLELLIHVHQSLLKGW